jgi:hypothetical protein
MKMFKEGNFEQKISDLVSVGYPLEDRLKKN